MPCYPALGLTLIALLLGASGCGGGDDTANEAPVAALKSFVGALRDGDAQAACDLLSAQTLEDLDVAGSCGEVMSAGFALIREEGVAIPDYEITDVSVDGDAAEATLLSESTETGVPLIREDGEWRVAGVTALGDFHPDSPLDSDSGSGEVGE